MSVAQWQAAYRREMKNGELVTLKRGATEATVRAKISGYAPSELVGDIMQGDRHIIMLAEDVTAEEWPDHPKRKDSIILSSGQKLTIEIVDEATARQGETFAYHITARG